MRRMFREIAGHIAILMFVVCSAAGQSVSAQSGSPESSGQGGCTSGEVRGFDQYPGPAARVYTNFLIKPEANADAAAIRTHIIYSRILLNVALARLYQSASAGQCPLSAAAVDLASLNLEFSLAGSVGQDGSKECALNRCARSLSELLRTVAVDRSTYSNAIGAIVRTLRRNDSADLRSPRLAAELAATEAIQHMYPPGSKERLVASTSSEDYKNTEFDQFAAWFARQQSALVSMVGTAPQVQPPAAPSTPSEDDDCASSADVNVGELEIDHHGWGHQSIIMIKNAYAYKVAGLAEIENTTLRALCDQGQVNSTRLGGSPWNEMTGRIQCAYLHINRDRWLILHGSQNPPTGADMRRYAQGVAKVIQEEKCASPNLQVLVVNFSLRR